jgi:hypothetical protein
MKAINKLFALTVILGLGTGTTPLSRDDESHRQEALEKLRRSQETP